MAVTKDIYQKRIVAKYAEMNGNYSAGVAEMIATIPAGCVVLDVKANVVTASATLGATATVSVGGVSASGAIDATGVIAVNTPFKTTENTDVTVTAGATDAVINVSVVYALPTGEKDYL